MKRRIICKGLTVAVIILFLGVGIQPAIAITPTISERINTLDKDDCDCDEKSSIWGFPVIYTFLFGLAVLCVYFLVIFEQLPYLFEIIGEIVWKLNCFWIWEPPMERLLSFLLL